MEHMRFTRLSLLSNKERRGLQIDLSAPSTVLIAGNGFGKSAILKSLYDALGAKPPKIDETWRNAAVITLLEFSVAGRNYSALKVGDTYTVQDEAKKVLICTTRVVSELAPFMADLLAFKLVLADKKDEIKVPPPSYIFAPFYVDQDVSWQKAWSSFKDLPMFSNYSKSLSEYHSGLRPNTYYEAKAERDRTRTELANIEAERRAVDNALKKIRDSMPTIPLTVDLQAFEAETEILLRESRDLHHAQAKYRIDLGAISEEFHLWSEHVAVVETALGELDSSFRDALAESPEVECPMCGQHYSNHIADQFELVADKDELIQALQLGRQQMNELHRRAADQRAKINDVELAIQRVSSVLAVRREDVSLHDVVSAEGRNEAQRVLLERMSSLDVDVGQKQRQIDEQEQLMGAAESSKRKKVITKYFDAKLDQFALALDVELPPTKRNRIQGLDIGRGSEGPRAQAAYYYAFLQTVREHGSAVFCPIVIDAPNQQGQDRGHLQQIMQFLLTASPDDAQVIIGSEAIYAAHGANAIDVTHKKRQVLREDSFDQSLEHIRPYLTQSII